MKYSEYSDREETFGFCCVARNVRKNTIAHKGENTLFLRVGGNVIKRRWLWYSINHPNHNASLSS
jgi:hypothetical protein